MVDKYELLISRECDSLPPPPLPHHPDKLSKLSGNSKLLLNVQSHWEPAVPAFERKNLHRHLRHHFFDIISEIIFCFCHRSHKLRQVLLDVNREAAHF